MSKRVVKILKYLAEHPIFTVRDMSVGLGKYRTTIQRLLNELEKEKLVTAFTKDELKNLMYIQNEKYLFENSKGKNVSGRKKYYFSLISRVQTTPTLLYLRILFSGKLELLIKNFVEKREAWKSGMRFCVAFFFAKNKQIPTNFLKRLEKYLGLKFNQNEKLIVFSQYGFKEIEGTLNPHDFLITHSRQTVIKLLSKAYEELYGSDKKLIQDINVLRKEVKSTKDPYFDMPISYSKVGRLEIYKTGNAKIIR